MKHITTKRKPDQWKRRKHSTYHLSHDLCDLCDIDLYDPRVIDVIRNTSDHYIQCFIRFVKEMFKSFQIMERKQNKNAKRTNQPMDPWTEVVIKGGRDGQKDGQTDERIDRKIAGLDNG